VVTVDDPRLEPTNNFSERMLRMEKLIESSSMFRASLCGRFVLDILRTALQIAVAARAPLQEYVLSVLCTDPEEIAAAAERFTPHAWVNTHLSPDATSDVEDDIMTSSRRSSPDSSRTTTTGRRRQDDDDRTTTTGRRRQDDDDRTTTTSTR
jgi:hypothetical protein